MIARLGSALEGRYAIDREIGRGGMATVYLARDVRHNRKVALKVLNPELGAVLGVERFLAEIEVTANLQHPNLLPLFDSGEANGMLFYVMPFIEGESLRARLDREKQLPVDEAIRITTAIAGALDYAHRHKVIHRDLKPENILMLEGQPLVADFGIALAVSKAGGERITQTGLSLGTPLYMSPEQATGDRVIDGRTDIYSLGAILYEMLTGDPPHTGSTAHAIIARLLTDKPRPVHESRETVPPYVSAAVDCALSKLPADRFATGAEFADALAGVRSMAATASMVVRKPVLSSRQRAVAIAPWVLVVGLGAAVLVRQKPGTVPESLKRLEVPFGDSVTPPNEFDVSPDGSTLYYVAPHGTGTAIFSRNLASTRATVVDGTEDAVADVKISPDGSQIAFITGQTVLKVVRVAGGPPTKVDSSVNYAIATVAWVPGGDIVYSKNMFVWRARLDGAAPQQLPQHVTQKGFLRLDVAGVMPGTTDILVVAWPEQNRRPQIGLVRLDDGAVAAFGTPGISSPRPAAVGRVLFKRSSNQLITATLTGTLGPEVPLVDSVGSFAVATDGTLFYSTSVPRRLLLPVVVDENGAAAALGIEPDNYNAGRVSRDGRWYLMELNKSIWAYDVSNKTLSQVSSGPQHDLPEWWPDGKRFSYSDLSTGVGQVMVADFDSPAGATVLQRDTLDLGPVTIGAPGTHIVTWRTPRMGSAGANLLIAPVDTPAAMQPLNTIRNPRQPRISPDGRLVAYSSDATGRWEVYVQAISGPGRIVTVSQRGGVQPVWSRDSRTLYFRSPAGMMSATITRTPELQAGRRQNLFNDVYANMALNYQAGYDVMPDGRHFLMFQSLPTPPRKLVALTNWQSLLTRRAKP